MHFYLISCFHDKHSDFVAYTLLSLICHKKDAQNIWSKSWEIEKLFIENEELNQIVIGKGLFAAVKGHLSLTKGYLDNPEGLVIVESFLSGICFWPFWFKLRIIF